VSAKDRTSEFLKKTLFEVETLRYSFAAPIFLTPIIMPLRPLLEVSFRNKFESLFEIITLMYSFFVVCLFALNVLIVCFYLKKLKANVLRVKILMKIIPRSVIFN
jgi:hypothetical protein